MGVIFATARERVPVFGQQLQHQLIRLETKPQQDTLITIIRADPVTGLKVKGRG
jgi:hypothetical protein